MKSDCRLSAFHNSFAGKTFKVHLRNKRCKCYWEWLGDVSIESSSVLSCGAILLSFSNPNTLYLLTVVAQKFYQQNATKSFISKNLLPNFTAPSQTWTLRRWKKHVLWNSCLVKNDSLLKPKSPINSEGRFSQAEYDCTITWTDSELQALIGNTSHSSPSSHLHFGASVNLVSCIPW